MNDSQLEAEGALVQELLKDPSNASLHFRLSEIYQRQGRATEAIAAGWRAVELAPDLAYGWLHLGSLLLDERCSPDDAEMVLRRAVELLPDEAMAHLRLGMFLLRRGASDEPLQAIGRARDLAPPEGWFWSEIGVAFTDAKSYGDARSAFQRALDYEPDVPLYHYRLGDLLQRLGRSVEALIHFRRAAELGPGVAWLQSHLGFVLTEAGDLDGAQAALDRAASLDPHDNLTRSRMAFLAQHREEVPRRTRRSEMAARTDRAMPITACIVLAAPRTGSTVLGQSVGEAWQTDFLGEIFHEEPDSASYEANFFRFRRALFHTEPSLIVPTLENQQEIFRAYCEHLRSISCSGTLLLGIKYYSWHHLNSCFVLPHEPPTLVDFVRETSWPVIHLVRENLFALYCSLKLSEKRGIWHRAADDPSGSDRTSVIIDLDAFRRDINRLVSATNIFNEWFGDYDSFHHLTYERLFEGERFSSEVEKTFRNLFDEPPAKQITPTTQKVTPPLRDVVENIDEVLRGLRDTPYHAMALAALE